MKHRYPLHNFVNRILVHRLVLVALSVSMLIGGTAWFTLAASIDNQVAFRG